MHDKKSDLAGKTITIKKSAKHFQFPDFGGSKIKIEDWQDRVTGKSWIASADEGNPACLVYVMRVFNNHLEKTDEVLYGHRDDGLGSLVHVSELELDSNEKVTI